MFESKVKSPSFHFNIRDILEYKESINEFEKGRIVDIYEMSKDLDKDIIRDLFSKNIRSFYIDDNDISKLINGCELSPKDYIESFIFPSPTIRPGPGTMAGEFGEILIYNFIENYWDYKIFKTRYKSKTNPNTPVTGIDVMGYKLVSKDANVRDNLFLGEVKTRASTNKIQKTKTHPLECAINDSTMDYIKLGISLHAEKHRLILNRRIEDAKVVQRFQNKTDTPYTINMTAAFICHKKHYCKDEIKEIIAKTDTHGLLINVLIIYADDLMPLIKDLYRRGAYVDR